MTRNCVAAGVLHVHAHRRGFAAGQQVGVRLLLDVVVAIELRKFGLDLRNQPAPTPSAAHTGLVGRRAWHAPTRRSPRHRRAKPASAGTPDCDRGSAGLAAGSRGFRARASSCLRCSSSCCDQCLRADDVRMLVGVSSAAVRPAWPSARRSARRSPATLVGGVDRRVGQESWRLARPARACRHRATPLPLAIRAWRSRCRRSSFESRPKKSWPAALPGHAHVLELEFLQAILGRLQTFPRSA